MTYQQIRLLSKSEVIEMINDMLKVMTQKELAEKAGVSTAYLNDIVHNRREPGEKFLKSMGLKKVVRFERESQ